MLFKKTLWFLLLISLYSPFALKAQEEIRIPVSDFNPAHTDSLENLLWSSLKLPKREATEYSLVTFGENTSIMAESNNSASGLVYKVDIDPKEYPIIEWEWKVNSVLAKGDYSKKSGDDYSARIYITFDYDKKNLGFADKIKYGVIKTFTSYPIPLRAINYIWANKAEIGTIAPNAYTDWVYMIAVQSGEEEAKTWKMEMRNIYDDYKTAFGEEPPRITGVAIMTDSDNTKGVTKAYYGDIIFKSK